ncbi:MAG: discoidin domain-containing protein [Clostridiales bacterium]|nr:discoidin domain-containing protein [Clostridiales bacterium]
MKKASLFKLIFLISFFTIFIIVSVIGSMGLFKFDSVKGLNDPKDFSATFNETENGYVFSLVNGREAYYTKYGAVGVRFNKTDIGVETDLTYYNYSTVTEIDGGYKAEVTITAPKGSKIKVTDYYSIANEVVDITRTIDVLEVGEDLGFTTEYPIFTQNIDDYSKNDWFNPAQFYVSGTHNFVVTNARTVIDSETNQFIISSDNTSALTLSKYKNGYVTTISDLSHTQQVTTYEDDEALKDKMIIDEDISVTGISFGNYSEEDSMDKYVRMSYCYPSYEQLWSDSGTVWRLLPVKENLSRTVSFRISIEAEEDYYSMVENAWRDAYNDMSIVDKRYDQEEVFNVLLDSMHRSYGVKPWGANNIPMYLTNAENYHPESGFLYRNADIALLMYKAGDRLEASDDASDKTLGRAYKQNAIKVLEYQIDKDKIDTGIESCAAGSTIYYRQRYEGLALLIDVYDYFKDKDISSAVIEKDNLKNIILSKAEAYKDETSPMGVIFYTKLWKYCSENPTEFSVDYSRTAIRLLDKIAKDNRFFGGYFGSVDNQKDKYIGVAEDAMIILNAYLNVYELTGSQRYLDLAKTCATWLETFNLLTPMNLNLKGDDGSKPYNSSFIGNQRFLAYGYNFNNTRHCILDCPTVSSAIDFEKLYEITGDKHYLDFAERLVYNSSIYVNMGDKVGLMDDPLNSSGKGFINEFVGNTASNADFPDGGIRGAAHTSNIAWCGYQLLYVYDKLAENTDSSLKGKIFEVDRTYDLAKYKLLSYDSSKFANFNYSPEKAVDGNDLTYWNSSSSEMVIDLNEVCGVNKITITSLSETNSKIKVWLSYDNVNFTEYAEYSFNGTKLIDEDCLFKTRYVKIQTFANDSIVGVSLMGLPEYYNTYSYTATPSIASASGCLDALNYNTAWSFSTDQTLELDFGEKKIITQTALTFETKWEMTPGDGLRWYQVPSNHSYEIYYEDANGVYQLYSQVTDEAKIVYVDQVTVETQKIKLVVKTNTAVKLQDFKVMGCDMVEEA